MKVWMEGDMMNVKKLSFRDYWQSTEGRLSNDEGRSVSGVPCDKQTDTTSNSSYSEVGEGSGSSCGPVDGVKMEHFFFLKKKINFHLNSHFHLYTFLTC